MEYLNDYKFNDINDVKIHVDYFIDFYNNRRIHQSLEFNKPYSLEVKKSA